MSAAEHAVLGASGVDTHDRAPVALSACPQRARPSPPSLYYSHPPGEAKVSVLVSEKTARRFRAALILHGRNPVLLSG